MVPAEQRLRDAALAVARELAQRRQRVVFAESCTAGLVAATLAEIPGISQWLCGSAVVYRDETKAAWLGVSRADLSHPQIGAVSETIARQMCQGALERTPEADMAVAVTGHLGPDAPAELDGVIFIVAQKRNSTPRVERRTLRGDEPGGLSQRRGRQIEAAELVLQATLSLLASQAT